MIRTLSSEGLYKISATIPTITDAFQPIGRGKVEPLVFSLNIKMKPHFLLIKIIVLEAGGSPEQMQNVTKETKYITNT